jgi:hypothetical protein
LPIVPRKMQINKTDQNDEEGLAQIMRTGWYRSVHVNRSIPIGRGPCGARELYNHFELPETLGNPDGFLGRSALELLGLNPVTLYDEPEPRAPRRAETRSTLFHRARR